MKANVTYIYKQVRLICIILLIGLIGLSTFAQNPDSVVTKMRHKQRITAAKINTSVSQNKSITNLSSSQISKSDKPITILKIYPMPVSEKLNISFRLNKNSQLTIKITDLLGNEVATLSNEKLDSGEYLKSYNLPAKLNSGIYFLRILVGNEPIIKRISIL